METGLLSVANLKTDILIFLDGFSGGKDGQGCGGCVKNVGSRRRP